MVEGLPGSGKSTTAHFIGDWLAQQGRSVAYYPEGRADHPVDLEQVAVLSTQEFVGLVAAFPEHGDDLMRGAAKSGDSWLVHYGRRTGWPGALRASLSRRDAYDGEIASDTHREVLRHSWDSFGERAASGDEVYLFECVLVQNPICALMARFDEPEPAITSHIRSLVDAVAALRPLVVYLDPGEPRWVLERAAAERPAEWLDRVISYHCGQGYGRSHGLVGFDGYVEFMRRRRELELGLLPRLGVTYLRVDVGPGEQDASRREITAFVGAHLATAGSAALSVGG